MNKKGFTLIELLAIIVILAIIAAIAIPQITKIIEKTRQDTAEISAMGYMDALEKQMMVQSQNDEEFTLDGEYIIENGNLKKDTEQYDIKVNGTIPSNGYLIITENDVISGCLTLGKYAASIENGKVSSAIKGNCLETYTITFNSNGGTEVSAIHALANKPITKPTNPTKENTTFLGWYTEQELTSKFNFSTLITQDITLYAKWGEPSLNDDSWDEIMENLNANRNYYPIGTTKTMTMNLEGTPKEYVLRIANTERPAVCDNKDSNNNLTYSQTACGVVIEFVTPIGKRRLNENYQNTGGWTQSEIRQVLNTNENSIYSKLPESLRNIIIPTAPIISSMPNDANNQNVTAPGDYLYLLSAREIGLELSSNYDTRNNVATETRTLQYYSSNNASRVKTNTSEFWWLRTATTDGANWICIGSNGSWYTSNSNQENYIAPAFRILE